MSLNGLRVAGLVVQGGLLGLGFLLAWFMAEPFWERMVFDLPSIGLGVVLTIPPLVIVILLSHRTSIMRDELEAVIELFRPLTVVDILIVSVLAGLGEEALFRGVMQDALAGWTNTLVAIIVVSVAFGLLHFLSIHYVIYVFFLGIYLGGIYTYTDNLVIPATIHFLYDFVAILYGVHFLGARSDSSDAVPDA